MSFQILKSSFFCFLNEFCIQICIACHEWYIHKRTIFRDNSSFEQFALIKEIIKNFCFPFVAFFHYFKSAHLLKPFEDFTTDIDSVCRWCIIKRFCICMCLICKHCRCSRENILCDQIFTDDCDHYTSRSDIFLNSTINHCIFCYIYRFGKKTGGDICHKIFSFCVWQCFKFCSVNSIVFTDIYVVCIF